jgi:hypothetical protein
LWHCLVFYFVLIVYGIVEMTCTNSMNTFYERINDGELFVYNEESKKFYLQEMKKFKDKGHLISEYTEETLDNCVSKDLFKKHESRL